MTQARCWHIAEVSKAGVSLYNHYHYYYHRIIENGGGHGLADDRPAHFFLSGPAAAPPGVTVRPATPTGCIGNA
ncbi:hypothetical protein QTP88_022243 [Uroleucon formosanum]